MVILRRYGLNVEKTESKIADNITKINVNLYGRTNNNNLFNRRKSKFFLLFCFTFNKDM